MKIKIFTVNKLFQKKDVQQEFEDLINNWLAENRDIEIVEIKQSASGGSFNPSELFISVWYNEPEILDKEEPEEDEEEKQDEEDKQDEEEDTEEE